MKSIALMVIFLGFSLVSAGQHLITDSGSALKKGMYKDFYEFKYNKPSLKFDYHFRPSKYANTYFNVSIDKESAKSIGEVYGFCDGKEVYLAFGQKLNSRTQFIRLAFIGRYCMYWYTTYNNVVVPINGISYILPLGKTDNISILDMNTGQRESLTNIKLKSILKDDPDIYNRYLSDAHYLENRAKYLVEYSLKHKKDILINQADLTTGKINEILAYKPSDSSFTGYSNRVINELAGCKDISKIEISSSKYSNGNYKFIGLRSTHNYGPNPDFSYKIGLWRYYDSKGDLKKEIMYDLTEHIVDQASTH
jgi:hypothetical protein